MKVNEKRINEVSAKLDKLLEKAGQFNKYQFTILILFTFQIILAQFFYTGLYFLCSKPYVKINIIKNDINQTLPKNHTLQIIPQNENIKKKNQTIQTISVILNQSLCKIKNYTVDKERTGLSIVLDFDIFCDETKTNLLSISLYIGMFCGSFLSYIFADRIGRKKSLIIIIPFHILSLFAFQLTDIKRFEHALYFLYFNIFFKGLTSRLVMILLIIYICDIINQKDIPLFINVILAGTPISEFASSYIFTFLNSTMSEIISWNNILAIDGAINILSYILFLCLVVPSPMFYLNNEDYDNFVKNLMKISKFNRKFLHKEDFAFLKPYMSSNQQKSVFINFEDDMDEGDFKENDLLYNDMAMDKNNKANLKEDIIFKSKNDLKKDFLMEAKENKNRPYMSLFGHLKMKDYSPIDLLKSGQIQNFLILSYLWVASTIVRDGFNIYFRTIPEYKDDFKYYVIMVFGEFIGFIFIYQTFTRKLSSFHSLLVTLLLLTFLIFAFGVYRNQEFNFYDFLQLFSIKVLTGSIFLILFVMTLLIYPVILRTHGLGGTLTLASIGDIICLFFANNVELDDISLYFLIFLFFALMLSYGLPKKIGTIILEKPREEEKKPQIDENLDNKDNNENKNNIDNKDSNRKTLNETLIEEEPENDISINNLELDNMKLK